MASFGQQLRGFEQDTLSKMDMAVRKLVLELLTRIVQRTPVDSGRARGNWQINMGALPSGVVEVYDKTGEIVISSADAALAGFSSGDMIFIVNNLPYIQRLEDGYSQQAPAGMVRLSVQEFQALADAIGSEVRQL